jgi:hypothetical protein
MTVATLLPDRLVHSFTMFTFILKLFSFLPQTTSAHTQPFAEIEVMKMVMSLSSPSSGVLTHRKVAPPALASPHLIS